tara:strand:- start:932 stop:1048 length:117 start_codon:yes stop_codon:yes gene_type:complete
MEKGDFPITGLSEGELKNIKPRKLSTLNFKLSTLNFIT